MPFFLFSRSLYLFSSLLRVPFLPLMQCVIVPCQAGARSHPAKCQRAAIGLQQIVLSLSGG